MMWRFAQGKPIPTTLDGVIFLSQNIYMYCMYYFWEGWVFSFIVCSLEGGLFALTFSGPALVKTGDIPDSNFGNENAPLLYKMWGILLHRKREGGHAFDSFNHIQMFITHFRKSM